MWSQFILKVVGYFSFLTYPLIIRNLFSKFTACPVHGQFIVIAPVPRLSFSLNNCSSYLLFAAVMYLWRTI